MKKNDKQRRKERAGIVYSTDPEFQYNYSDKDEEATLPPSQQTLYIAIDRKNRKGKTATLISNFIGSSEDRSQLARQLKSKCSTGGSVKEDQILIQGDFRDKIIQILSDAGYKIKRKGG